MDAVLIKQENLTIACSLAPVGVFGWGKDEKTAITALGDNLYDFCNWMQKPLPKDTEVKILARYKGEIENLSFSEDCKIPSKKLAEVVMQSAFSLKCFLNSFSDSKFEEQFILDAYSSIGISSDEGVIGFASALIESGDIVKMRAFAFLTYKVAKQTFIKLKQDGAQFTDTFKFEFSYGI